MGLIRKVPSPTHFLSPVGLFGKITKGGSGIFIPDMVHAEPPPPPTKSEGIWTLNILWDFFDALKAMAGICFLALMPDSYIKGIFGVNLGTFQGLVKLGL